MAKIQGFFTDEDLDSVSMSGASAACDKCGLASGCKSPQMGYVGEGNKSILIISECPSEADDTNGKPMSGETSEWLEKKLRSLGINMNKDCWKTNVVGCHPAHQKDKKPTKAQIKYCRLRLFKTIEELKPKYIWLLGFDAVYSYFHDKADTDTIDQWRGLCVPSIEHSTWVFPLYHPQFIQRLSGDEHLQKTFINDLANAIRRSKYPHPPEAMSLEGAEFSKDFDTIIEELKKVIVSEPAKLAFDYETTGLKPYRSGHRIATVSFCYDYDFSFAFPYQYCSHFSLEQRDAIADLWEQIMTNPKIKKIMHNSKFEDTWTREMFGVEIENKFWCSMNAAHILDTRSLFCGLKQQACVRWGIPNYDKNIEKYLKNDKGTPYNKVMSAPLNDLLLYNSIDSLLTFRLQEEQEEEFRIEPGLEKGRLLFMDGLDTFCDMQENGICSNNEYYVAKDAELGKKLYDMEENLFKYPEMIEFERRKGRRLNFNSSKDLSELFFDILKLSSKKKTKTGADCVDKSVLATLNTPIAKEKTEIGKLEKIKGTYLAQFLREFEDDRRIHPFFDLHTTNTLRGSSSNPNFQNVPVRDFEAMTITRGGIIPSPGFQLIDWDYGSMEVRIIACITQDPELIRYVNDPKSDMHRDQAMELFAFTGNEWEAMKAANKRQAKDIRFHAKNGMVFALFYGSYYGSIARNLFPLLKELKTGNISLFEHLRNKGVIRSLSSAYDDYENHVKRVEQKFWHRFKYVKKWQENAFKKYLEVGYIEQMFGFKIGGWLTKNDICNYPVQGTAFHCLVWSLNKLNKRMKEIETRSKLVGQIHDCCLGDVHPEERLKWCNMSFDIATKEIREANPWIIVPLDIEFEESAIDRPWSEKKEFFLHTA